MYKDFTFHGQWLRLLEENIEDKKFIADFLYRLITVKATGGFQKYESNDCANALLKTFSGQD